MNSLHKKRIRLSLLIFVSALLFSGCKRYEPQALNAVEGGGEEASLLLQTEEETAAEIPDGEESETESEEIPEEIDTRIPTRVKGIYLASKPLGNESFMSTFWDYMDATELNAVVIDVKDDYGKITYDMKGVALEEETHSVEISIPDLPGLIEKFKEHNIYTIARIVSFRDPYMGNRRPDLCYTNEDGTLYKDNSGYAWINPYKEEYWDYLLEIGLRCAADGFDEVQFDYIRFCTDKGAGDCVFDEEETLGRDKISIITEVVQYLTENLKEAGVFVSVDVFGTIINSSIDSRSVGQDYTQLAGIVDYMSPMIYPSHYAAGNFGLDMPDLHPYESILGALQRSKSALSKSSVDGGRQAVVRPWLQAFTATWLGSGNYLTYDASRIREEIEAVYDAGYDEWILWSSSVSYDFSGFLTPAEGEREYEEILESRAALPEEEILPDEETLPAELSEALDGDDFYEEDRRILEQYGPIITYE